MIQQQQCAHKGENNEYKLLLHAPLTHLDTFLLCYKLRLFIKF